MFPNLSWINTKLSRKFAFWTIFVILLLQLLNSFILITTKKREISRDILDNAQYFARLTTGEIVEHYLKYNDSGYFKFYDLLDELLTLNQEIHEIYIIKTNGEVIFSPEDLKKRRPPTTGAVVQDAKMLARLESVELSHEILHINGEKYIDIVSPFFGEWGRRQYSVRFLFSFHTLEQKIAVMRNQIMLIGVVSVAFGVLLILSLTNRITNSLQKLMAGVRKIARGDLSRDVTLTSRDEVGELSEAVNQMRRDLVKNFDQLMRTQDNLKELNLTLETKVRERTQQLEEKNKELKRISVTDRLTGLFNRTRLDEVLGQEFHRSERFGNSFGLILLDIDHFKQVNDVHGHQVGDQVLVDAAKILDKNTRQTDTLGRWGGEEFMVICPQAEVDGIATLAENLRSAFANHDFPVVGEKTASFGVSVYEQGDTMDTLVAKADEALYAAKEGGRNRVKTKIKGAGASLK